MARKNTPQKGAEKKASVTKRNVKTKTLVEFMVTRPFAGLTRGHIYKNVDRETAVKWEQKGRGYIV